MIQVLHSDPMEGNVNDYFPLVTQQMKEIKDSRLTISEKDKDVKEEQTNDESLSRNNESSTKSFNSRQEDPCNIVHNLEGGKLELATNDLKHRIYHVKKDNNLIQNRNDASK